MKSYPAYKESSVGWIGKIPDHWGVFKLKRTTQFIYGNSLSKENRVEGSIPVYGSNGIVGKHNEAITLSPCIVIGRKGSFGKVNFSEVPSFPIDTTYFVDKTATANHIRWLYYLLLSLRLDAFSKDSAVPGLSREDAYERRVVLPHLPEQQAIADFLDRKTAQIDTLIEKKQRQIELLQEQRTALINQAVTKGLDPSVPMKDSGIEWLGEIPMHWDVIKGKYIFSIESGSAPSQMQLSEQGTIDYIKVDDLNTDDNTLYMYHGKEKFDSNANSFFDEGIVVFPKRGAAIFTNKVKITKMKCMFDTNLMGLQMFPSKALREFVTYCLLSRRLDDIADTSTVPQINNKHIYPLIFPIPDLNEQKRIINYIENQSKKLDRTIALTAKEIHLLQEYRTALISAAVTGKIDVRDEFR